MLFNSFEFLLFLPTIFFLHWLIARSPREQNAVLLSASYFFYACWDWRFLFLLTFSTVLDFITGIKIHETKKRGKRKLLLFLSLSINLGFLGIFKYYNFFVESLTKIISTTGLKTDVWTLNIILPVGISFYTFHGISYIVDVYKERVEPERNIIDYSIFVSFFPLLVAGPIERATNLLPQIKKIRKFEYLKGVDGLRQIMWGLFKKIVIADNCAEIANEIFNTSSTQSGSNLLLGAILFAFQIYGDFSGYSDIALGTARLFGIELLQNFSYPYFSRSIAEFWRRWHISLSSWFKDYVYIPLGGSKGGNLTRIRNTFIIFILSGLWHGANWTFVMWGLINAILITPAILLKTNRSNMNIVGERGSLPSAKEAFQIMITFLLTVLAWVFFRSSTIQQAFLIIKEIFSKSLFSLPTIMPLTLSFYLFCFLIIEWIGREEKYALEKMGLNWSSPLRYSLYYLIIISLFIFNGKSQEFIYFQF
jgi:alginate O-acetyltransferase complex protein AlgI